MSQLENIEAIERRLWSAADTLRANSNYAGNEYFMPVMGLVFLRHAFSWYLAMHGLVGDIKKAITYYEDPHNLHKKADFVMANPPFNVDEIDADKIKNDPRLPFGLPGVNKKGKVSNGNYVWISYFYSYLTEQGRAGFVMSSQASSAGNTEAKVREKLIETGHVDIMISIRSNFFYTRTVPCELWFFNKSKSAERKDKVLMIDARNIFRKVTRKIYDFSPEQLQNILSIIWLYRSETEHFHDLVVNYISAALNEAAQSIVPAQDYATVFAKPNKELQPFLATLPKDGKQAETVNRYWHSDYQQTSEKHL